MNVPKKVTIYNYYGHAVYFDDVLFCYLDINHRDGLVQAIIRGMDIQYEYISKDWRDMPGRDKGVRTPPRSLAELENHFKQQATASRFQQLAQAKRDVLRLEKEIARNL